MNERTAPTTTTTNNENKNNWLPEIYGDQTIENLCTELVSNAIQN